MSNRMNEWMSKQENYRYKLLAGMFLGSSFTTISVRKKTDNGNFPFLSQTLYFYKLNSVSVSFFLAAFSI